MNQELFGQFYTMTFSDVWNKAEDFVAGYKSNGIPVTISDKSCTTLYYLLYAKYGNSSIRNMDVNQFEYKVWSTIFKYGPTWEKRLEIQEELRKMSIEDLQKVDKRVFNHALNPGTAPTTNTTNELEYINEQTVNKGERSKINAYANLMGLLETDVTEQFLSMFSKLFIQVLAPYQELIYQSEVITKDE